MKTIIVILILFGCSVAWGSACMREGCLVYHAEDNGLYVIERQSPRIDDLQKEIDKLKEKLNWLLKTLTWERSPLSEIYEYREKDDKFYPKLDVVPN